MCIYIQLENSISDHPSTSQFDKTIVLESGGRKLQDFSFLCTCTVTSGMFHLLNKVDWKLQYRVPCHSILLYIDLFKHILKATCFYMSSKSNELLEWMWLVASGQYFCNKWFDYCWAKEEREKNGFVYIVLLDDLKNITVHTGT